MTAMPTGTVTFLLTDMVGRSARSEDGPGARSGSLAPDGAVVAHHAAIVSSIVQAHGGAVVTPRTAMAGVLAAFSSALDAARAAASVQRVLAAEPWATGAPPRGRVALHTAEVQARQGAYDAQTVSHCSSLLGVGHGGQTLLSETTFALVRETPPPDTALVDLGLHQIRDLVRPERVAQMTVEGLPSEFPPLASLRRRTHNLPMQSTPFVGRQREIHDICRQFMLSGARLVTLTGPGGSGKTRLAVQAAIELLDRCRDGVVFVDLSPLAEPGLVAPTIARALGLHPAGERPVLDDIRDHLQNRQILLLLDNFERVLEAAEAVVALLQVCPELLVLATSRAPLRVREEYETPVSPLAVPNLLEPLSPSLLTDCESVELFVGRARAAQPDFALTATNAPVIAEICARLEGLPLALELAAARLRSLAPEAMLARLGRRLDILTGGPRDLPARQQTLRQTIAWSYDLLGASDRRLFRRLSVFVGGFTLGAAASICSADDGEGETEQPAAVPEPPLDPRTFPAAPTREAALLDALDRLVMQSLLRSDRVGAEPRFTMLETIREFGLEQLAAMGEFETVSRRHLHWCAELAVQANSSEARQEGHRIWYDRLETEHENFRAALGFGVESGRDPETVLLLTVELGRGFWPMRGHFGEARVWLSRVLALPLARSANLALALDRAGYLAIRQHDYDAASSVLVEALALWRELDDASGVAVTLRNMAVVAHHHRDYDRAFTLFAESLATHRRLDDRPALQMTLLYFGDLARDSDAYAEAASSYHEGIEIARTRADTHGVAYGLRGLGLLARATGDYGAAEGHIRESLRLLRQLRDRRCTPLCLEALACMAVGPDWAVRAARLFGAAHAIQAATGAPAPPSEHADYLRTELDARNALGETRYRAAWTDGSVMSLDAVVAYALDEPLAAGDVTESVVRVSLAPVSPGGAPVTTVPRSLGADRLAAVPAVPSEVAVRPPDMPLSTREREVVALIAAGHSNREIAARLVISVRTVERHIENVYHRLGISGKAGRAIVTAYACRHGLAAQA